MNEQAKEARRLYKREWNRRNKDKVKAAQERYWERKAAQMNDAEQPEVIADGQSRAPEGGET